MGLLSRWNDLLEKDKRKRKAWEEKKQLSQIAANEKIEKKHLETQQKIAAIKEKKRLRMLALDETKGTYSNIKSKDNTKTFKIAGTSFRENEIKQLLTVNSNYKSSKLDLIKKNLIDKNIYEYLPLTTSDFTFEYETDNEYDPNAIRVIVSGIHVGYIKKGKCSELKNLIKKNKIEAKLLNITGGNYKSVYSDNIGSEDLNDYQYDSSHKSFSISVDITTLD